MTPSLSSFAYYKNVNISRTKKDMPKRKTPFFFTLKSLSNRQQSIIFYFIGTLREKERLFRYRAYFEGNVLSFVSARAHVCVQMTQIACAVGMCNAILRNHLKGHLTPILFLLLNNFRNFCCTVVKKNFEFAQIYKFLEISKV